LAGQGAALAGLGRAAAATGPGAAVITESNIGYSLATAPGAVYSFGQSKGYGSAGSLTLNRQVVGIAGTDDGLGYWEAAADGGVFAYGDAQFYGSLGGVSLNAPVVGMAATPDGGGYWLVASDGGVFAFGDAGFFGSMGGRPLDAPVVGMAATPDGGGYWLVASDGGVFSFGDGAFYGSTANTAHYQPVVAIAATHDGGGYWEVAGNGAVFTFGDAASFGTASNTPLNEPIVGLSVTADGGGYWLVGGDGGVFAFGDALFEGSLPGQGTSLDDVVGITGHLTLHTTPPATATPPAPAAPTIISLTPTGGPTAGGTVVTITGTGFTAGAGVKFGAVAAASVHVVSATRIQATDPSGSPGVVTVTVTTPSGTSNPEPFTYRAGPTLTKVTPDAGPTAGGNAVTLTGTGFTGATAVTFGTKPAAPVTVHGPTSITATVPAGTAGTVTVTVTTPAGVSNAEPYTYDAVPVLTQLTPAKGPTTGGTPVTLTGSGFTPTATVTFGGTPARTVEVVDAGEITVVSPGHGKATVPVTVSTPGGTSGARTFSYYPPAPVITRITPTAGPIAGGNLVTIIGHHLTNPTTVTFGTEYEDTFVSDTATTIEVPAPPHAAGTVGVTFYGDAGPSNSVNYTYDAAPTITEITPGSGPTSGGTTVALTGTNFTPTATVTFGGAQPATLKVTSTSRITFVTPPFTATTETVTRPVTVSTPGGTSNSVTFHYAISLPTITSVTPGTAPLTGGGTVTIHGTHLTRIGTLEFGTEGSTFTVVSPTEITATVPRAKTTSETSTVEIIGYWDGRIITGPEFHYFVPVPVITSLTPSSGPASGGTQVTIRGTDLGVVGYVYVGTTSVTYVISATTRIEATIPSGTPTPTVAVYVEAYGSDSNSLEYHYNAFSPPTTPPPPPRTPPELSSLNPDTGPTSGGTTVTLDGDNLTEVTAVYFGGDVITYTIDGWTRITVTTPSHAAGSVTVWVTSPYGGSNDLSFDYTVPPAVLTSITPDTGPSTGGTTVTLHGAHLDSVTSVWFGGSRATFIVTSPTTIVATSPAGTGGSTVTVTVTSPDGSSGTARFHYSYPVPFLTYLTPDTGPSTGGTTVTLYGAHLTYVTAVHFGAASVTFTITSPTTITATSPPGTAGTTVSVTVTSPGGPSNGDEFHYDYPLPHLTYITPETGPATGGTTVYLHGSHLTYVTAVYFGGTSVTFTVTSSTTITAISPPNSPGATLPVSVTSPGGASNSESFYYFGTTGTSTPQTHTTTPVTMTSVTPTGGPDGGGTHVVIYGSDLTRLDSLYFGSVQVSFTYVSPTEVVATSPAEPVGTTPEMITGYAETSLYVSGPYFDYYSTTYTTT
jgi:hypothetical protein